MKNTKADNFSKNIDSKLKKLFKKNFSNISFSLLPVRSVGVQGDNRTYAHPLAIWGTSNWKKLAEISRMVTNSIKEINRVILLLNPKDKNKFNACGYKFLNSDRIELLRNIDGLVNSRINISGIYNNIWQFPVVLLPISDKSGKEPHCSRV